MFTNAIVYFYNGKTNKEVDFDYYAVKNLDSPVVQRMLECVEEMDYLDIKKIGLLFIKNVEYTKDGGIVLFCRRVRMDVAQ